MSVTILICSCGRRLKVAGMAPGKRGRCPSCGDLVRVPDAAPPPEEDEWNWQGEYDLGEVRPALGDRPAGTGDRRPDDPEVEEKPSRANPPAASIEEDEWNWQGPGYELGTEESASRPPEPREPEGTTDAGPRRVLPAPAPAPAPRPERWWPPNPLYPFRAAEGIAMMAALGVVSWVMGTLVPEYCLALVADGERLGTPTMGHLVSLITALPVLLMAPPFVVYWIQYLARVLIASAEGEARPPRPPDRNFDGLLDGLGRWVVWALLGAGVAFLPLAAYASAASGGATWDPRIAAGLVLLGLPYATMALLLTFLHDDAVAANPVAVLLTVGRLGLPFFGLSLTIAATLGLAAGAFAAAFALRNQHFTFYVAASLGCWLLAAGASILAMHTLGAYYYPRRDRLGWRRERPRWGAG